MTGNSVSRASEMKKARSSEERAGRLLLGKAPLLRSASGASNPVPAKDIEPETLFPGQAKYLSASNERFLLINPDR